jgi:hypothetical protein
MFSNRLQVAQVCRTLTYGIAPQALFTPAGPSEAAQALRQAEVSALPGGDRALLELAFWLWEGGQSPRMGAVIELVDRTRLRMVGTLLVALSEGAAAIDRWLRAHGGAVGNA